MPLVKYNPTPVNTAEVHQRIFIIDNILVEKKHITRSDLHKKINQRLDENISIETLDKDIKRLKEYIDIHFEGEELLSNKIKGYYYKNEGFSINKGTLDENDKSLLLLAGNLFKQFRGTPFEKKFKKIVEKIFKTHNIYIDFSNEDDEVQYYFPSQKPYIKNSQWLDFIFEAIFNKRTLEMNYDSPRRGEAPRIISPYVIRHHENKWYLVAFDHSIKENNEKVFGLDKIKDLKISKEKYKDTNFDPSNYFKYTIGIWHQHNYSPLLVKFKVNKYLLDQSKLHPIHETQNILEEKPDGTGIISIEVYNSPELKKLILSFGSQIEVLEPIELKNEIITSIKKMYSSYKID